MSVNEHYLEYQKKATPKQEYSLLTNFGRACKNPLPLKLISSDWSCHKQYNDPIRATERTTSKLLVASRL